MIRHDDIRMELIALKSALAGAQGIHHEAGDFRHAQM
jgi:hypothetical protein